jgi:hypothetical protein
MNELALFAGAGGGILGGKLLGWRTVCAVEWESYPASVLCARQNDGILPPFPIWDDVQTFDGNRGQDLLMSYQADFRAKTSLPQEKAQESMENGQECGKKWQGSFAKYDPNLSLWKTAQCSLIEDLTEFSQTWPTWGSMRNGECWERQTSGLNTIEKEYGLLPDNERFFHTPTTGSSGGSNSRKAMQKRGVVWPTPTTGTGGGNAGGSGVRRTAKENGTYVPSLINPNLYEWLMGWPLEWTEIKPLEMDKYHKWRQLHGTY